MDGLVNRRAPRVKSVRTVAWRGALLCALALVMAHEPLSAAFRHPSTRHLGVLPIWIVLIVLGQYSRGINERPIHDRQTDGIIATALIGISGVIYWTVSPRLGVEALQFWIEIPLFFVFVLGWCVAFFGTRPTFRHWRAWYFAILFGWPLTYQLLVDVVTGLGASQALALLPVSAMASALAVARPRRHAVFAAALTLLLGLIGALLSLASSSNGDLLVASLASLGGSFPWLLAGLRRFVGSTRTAQLVVQRTRLTEVAAIALALVLSTGTGTMNDPTSLRFDGTVLASALDVHPTGWELLTIVEVPDPDRIFRGSAVWMRSYWRADAANDWAVSRDGRPRTIVIDNVRVHDVSQLVLVPFPAQYDLSDWERTRVIPIDGDSAELALLAATLDRPAAIPLAAAFVNVDASVEAGGGQRITAIAVDDHRTTAPFPLPGRGFRADTWMTVQRLLRGDVESSIELIGVKDAELLELVVSGVLRGVDD